MPERTRLSQRAVYLLEAVLLPRALIAAGLPLHSTLNDLLALELSLPPFGKTYIQSQANDYFGDLILPGALALAKELAQTPSATQLCDCLLALIWRDADALAVARELAFETQLPDIDNTEYEQRYALAQTVWQGWQQADLGLMAEIQTFLEIWSSELF